MAFKKIRSNVVLAKYNGTPITTDSITLASPVSINPTIASGDIDQVSNTLGSKRGYVDGYQTTAEFDIEMIARIGDSVDTAPEVAELLKMSMIKSETNDPGVDITYNIDSVNDQLSTTFSVYEDGEKHEIVGRVGNVNINGKVGEPLRYVFNVSGYLSSTINEANPSVTLDNNDMLFVDKITGFTENGSTVNISEFSLNMRNEIANNYNVGLTEFSIIDFDPELTLTRLKIKNDLTVWDDLFNQNLKNVVITVTNQANTRTMTINVPTSVLKNAETGDQNGLQTISKTYRAQNNIGDDNFDIVYS